MKYEECWHSALWPDIAAWVGSLHLIMAFFYSVQLKRGVKRGHPLTFNSRNSVSISIRGLVTLAGRLNGFKGSSCFWMRVGACVWVHVPSCKAGQWHRITGNSLLIVAVPLDTRDSCQMNQILRAATTTNNPITFVGGLRDDSHGLSAINN